ncbi:amidohydrolase family protein [Flagellimonas marina]|uniref:Amidohydrolase family protein n=1 Tax=Flagellimonas marina TaxID=1775168 RepID=A0ABV8PLF6_9FLAO
MKKQFYFLLCLIFICSCTQNKPTDVIVLKNATIYNGKGDVIKNGIIIIQGGTIVEIGDKTVNIPKSVEIIDITGKFVTPGLIDSHIHFAQTGFFDARPNVVDLRDYFDFDELQNDLKNNPQSYYDAYLRSGVMGVYDVGGFLWSITRQKEAENNYKAPHVAASGPLLSGVDETRLDYFNTSDAKQMVYLSSPEMGRETVKQYSKLGSTGIKIWGVMLKDSSFMKSLQAVADETHNQNNKLIVHATSLDQAKEALRLGAKILVHSVDDKEVDEEFIQLALKNDIIYLPTITVTRGYLEAFKSFKEKRDFDDANNALDVRAKTFLETSTDYLDKLPKDFNLEERISLLKNLCLRTEPIMMLNLKKVHESGIRVAVATDAGNPGTFHGISIYDEMEIMQKAGIEPKDIIIMATQNGAIAMERANDFGTLEKGKFANLIILEEDPAIDITNFRSITHVMRSGVINPIHNE